MRGDHPHAVAQGLAQQQRVAQVLAVGTGHGLFLAAMHDQRQAERAGTLAGRRFDLGPFTLLELEGSGLRVVVGSLRRQLLEPRMLEMHGVDIAAARCVVAKSRGHFRAGFDEFFPDSRIFEVDAPGLTSPVLATTSAVPRPNTIRCMARKRARLNSRPMLKNRNTTPNSAKCRVSGASGIQPKACGPIRIPTIKYPSIAGNFKMRHSTTTPTAAASKISKRCSESFMKQFSFLTR